MTYCNWKEDRNLTMLTDFYEFTMSNGYFAKGFRDKIAVFDNFFRCVPDDGGYAIMAGVEQLIEYLVNLKFSNEDLVYLKGKGIFSDDFLGYLRDFEFACDVWAIPEGTPIFPNEPIITVKGPIIQAQLIETMLLLTINHQSLIATKANRIVKASGNRAVMEFGSRRAQGYDGALYGARSAFIGGCVGTACTIAERNMGIPVMGTMAHSWIQAFPTELDAFRAYAEIYPQNCTLLVDTYNVLKSGVPNAIKVFKEVIVPNGFRPQGVRIDSGDITYLSQQTRRMLDEAGFDDCKIIASNSLDEFIIRDILIQGAKVDIFGVGERLITAKSEPVFGGVYKLVAIQEDNVILPKIKVSENVEKITNPGQKKVFRLFDNASGKAIADVITLADEIIDDSKPYEIFDPVHTWKRKIVTDFTARNILVQIFDKGKLKYKSPELSAIQKYCREQVGTLWEDVTRFENPRKYYVDLSSKLWSLKSDMLKEFALEK